MDKFKEKNSNCTQLSEYQYTIAINLTTYI